VSSFSNSIGGERGKESLHVIIGKKLTYRRTRNQEKAKSGRRESRRPKVNIPTKKGENTRDVLKNSEKGGRRVADIISRARKGPNV